MRCYCCVQGCSYNSLDSNKNEKAVTLHKFPDIESFPKLHQKWLRAIGRPDWNPPKRVRICSAHFRDDMMHFNGYKTCLLKDAFPVNGLPANSNCKESSVKVCRMCLATDVKMHGLHKGPLKVSIENIYGLREMHNIIGLSQFVCFECAAILLKCNKLIEKSKIAQATLLDIFAKKEHVKEFLEKQKCQKQLNLQSSLGSPISFPIFEYVYNEEDGIAYPKTEDNANNVSENEKETTNLSEDAGNNPETMMELDDIPNEGDIKFDNNYFIDDFVDSLDFVEKESISDLSGMDGPQSADSNKFEDEENRESDDCSISSEKISDSGRQAYAERRAQSKKDFRVEFLTLKEQKAEFKKEVESTFSLNTPFQCEVCKKKFLRKRTFEIHILHHDPSRGQTVCPVCKYRFKRSRYLTKHAHSHSKRYHCKRCPKVLLSWDVAKKHLFRHLGVRYNCPDCDYSSLHIAHLSEHRRREHAVDVHCARCGHSFVSEQGLKMHNRMFHPHVDEEPPDEVFECDLCDLSFYSEEALRVHIMNAKVHKDKELSSPYFRNVELKKVCKVCGVVFASAEERRQHGVSEHYMPKTVNTKPPKKQTSTEYPQKCAYCDVTVKRRKEHFYHICHVHPEKRNTWKPVISAVCHTCGKGCQTMSALRTHTLKHANPTMQCPACPRLFHTKAALAMHAVKHAPLRPHKCSLCPLRFKRKNNMLRHRRVHSDEQPFACTRCNKTFKYPTSLTLHVRTAHLNMPYPPRAKRTSKKT